MLAHTHAQLSIMYCRPSIFHKTENKGKLLADTKCSGNDKMFFGNRQMSRKEIKLMFSDINNEEIISWLCHQQGVKYFVVFLV